MTHDRPHPPLARLPPRLAQAAAQEAGTGSGAHEMTPAKHCAEIERALHENGLALLYCTDTERREVLLAEREALLKEREAA